MPLTLIHDHPFPDVDLLLAVRKLARTAKCKVALLAILHVPTDDEVAIAGDLLRQRPDLLLRWQHKTDLVWRPRVAHSGATAAVTVRLTTDAVVALLPAEVACLNNLEWTFEGLRHSSRFGLGAGRTESRAWRGAVRWLSGDGSLVQLLLAIQFVDLKLIFIIQFI